MDSTRLGYPFLLNICILYCLCVCVCACTAHNMRMSVHVHMYKLTSVCCVCMGHGCVCTYYMYTSILYVLCVFQHVVYSIYVIVRCHFFPHACECYKYSGLQLSHQLLGCTRLWDFTPFVNKFFGNTILHCNWHYSVINCFCKCSHTKMELSTCSKIRTKNVTVKAEQEFRLSFKY